MTPVNHYANKALTDYGAGIVEEEIIGNNYRVIVGFTGDLQKFSYSIEHAAKVISIGFSLDIVKDVGTADDVDGTFSFLVSTAGEIGYAKDRLAAKPMVMYENEDLVAAEYAPEPTPKNCLEWALSRWFRVLPQASPRAVN